MISIAMATVTMAAKKETTYNILPSNIIDNTAINTTSKGILTNTTNGSTYWSAVDINIWYYAYS